MFFPYNYPKSSTYFNAQLKKHTFKEAFFHLFLPPLPYELIPQLYYPVDAEQLHHI